MLLINPAARSSRRLLERAGKPSARLDRLIATLRAGGIDCELALTRAPGHAAALAREARASGGFAAVFAVGGDGMLRETAIGLLGGDLPLAPLPAGTANVLARVLGVPLDAERAAALYARGAERCVRRLDVGVVEPGAGASGAAEAIPFLMMASRGLDARALELLPPAWKRRFGRAGVALSGLRELARGVGAPFDYRVDGGPTRRATFLSVCNIALYGGRFVLAGDARPDDRELDVVAHAGAGRAALLAFALRVVLGRAARSVRAQEVVLPGAGAAALQVDGDAFPVALPARIALATDTLPVLVPRRDPAATR
jgi:diacylglycerol kinase family enzyme